MTWSSVEQKLLEQQNKITALDIILAARLKRTVKVESEMRTMAREIESGSLVLMSMPNLKEQLRKWAVKLGCPDGDQL